MVYVHTGMASFVQKFIASFFSIGLTLCNVSYSRGESKPTVSITATVLPKTPQINYRKLRHNVNSRIQPYYKKGRTENQGKYRVTVNLDFPEGDQGMMIEEVKYHPNFGIKE